MGKKIILWIQKGIMNVQVPISLNFQLLCQCVPHYYKNDQQIFMYFFMLVGPAQIKKLFDFGKYRNYIFWHKKNPEF